MTNNGYILALDVGEKRIGAALASPVAKLARPIKVIQNSDNVWEQLTELINEENIGLVIVGLPRSLEGNDTAQTTYVRDFAKKLTEDTGLEVVFQDEALTSHQAEEELRANGRSYEKSDIDTLAATYILEDYLGTINGVQGGNV
jgi:putative Holliday junction resolvase